MVAENIRTTLAEFIVRHDLTMSVKRVEKRADGLMGDMRRHFHCRLSSRRCRLSGPDTSMTVLFSQGAAHIENPTLADVLSCLASDAAGIDGASSFEEWAREYGYDEDSRKAERAYTACSKQAAELRAFLGEDAYTALLCDVESA